MITRAIGLSSQDFTVLGNRLNLAFGVIDANCAEVLSVNYASSGSQVTMFSVVVTYRAEEQLDFTSI